MKFPQPLNVLYCLQTIKLAIGAVVESLHAWLKEVFRSLSNHTATYLYLNLQSK